MTPEEAIRVEFRSGRMEAYIQFPAGVDLDWLTVHACAHIVQGASVLVTNDVQERIRQAIAQYKKTPDAPLSAQIAVGTPPQPGFDGSLEWNEGYDPTSDTLGRPSVGENQRVDHYSTSVYRMAGEGDHIATLREPTSGIDGVAVDGGVIPAPSGKPYRLRTDRSVEIDDEGRIVATRSGLITFANDYLRILDLLEISEYVDFNTGHLDFDGSVVVHKGVRDCFRVNCSGDLVIHGLIEAANIYCGGNASFHRGMAGREKGTIAITGNLHARYLEGVSGSVEHDLEIERELVNCDLSIGRSLNVLNGAIIGGCIRVARNVVVDMLGSPLGVPTFLSVGDVPELTEAIVKLDKMIPIVNARRTVAVQHLEMVRNSSSQLNREFLSRKLAEAQGQIDEWTNRLIEIDHRKREIRETFEHLASATIHVNKCLHADSVIVVRGHAAKIKTDVKGPLMIHLDNQGEPAVTDLTAKASLPLISIATQVDFDEAIENTRRADESLDEAA